MQSKIHISEDILATIDFSNTLNGGASEVTLNVERGQEGYQITIAAPSLKADDFEIDILSGRLVVYHLLPLFAPSDTLEPKQSMRVLGNLYLPNDADFEHISARYEPTKRHLKIFMPFNHNIKDARWHIDVEQ
jgi:hypothetical protein